MRRPAFTLAAVLLSLGVSASPLLAAAAVSTLPPQSVLVPQPRAAAFFRLGDVTLGAGPFADARDANAAYLLSLQPDRLLHGFRKTAGLPPKAAAYGGWESRGLAGHTLGHYLTALSWMAESTKDPRYRERLHYTVAELAACQEQTRDGLLCAVPEYPAIFAAVAKGDLCVQRFSINDGWVPWYNLHKLFAGLRDAHVHGGNTQALAVLRRLADWAVATTSGLSDEHFQRMLYAEHGGMNEVLADLYSITGDARHLALARRFCDREILAPLARGEDRLDGFHANTQIPKLVGAARLHELTGDAAFGAAASNFWTFVTRDRSWVIGGNSEAEHFFPHAQTPRRLTHSTAETCNTHNMLRLTEELYALHPEAGRFDFYERALYNHILASIDPATGHCTYFMSLRPGFFKYYGDAENAFWCCTGTGLENHAKYARGIYAHSPAADRLFVNLFIPSSLEWRARGVRLEQATRFPEEDATALTIRTAQPARFRLSVRSPAWLAAPATLTLNGAPFAATVGADGYLDLDREWRDGDTLVVTLPQALRTEALPGDARQFAFLHGPIVLAGRLGTDGLESVRLQAYGENEHRTYVPPPPPVIVAAPDAVLTALRPVPGQPLTWRTDRLVQPADVELIPFYRLHHERHVVYWTRYSPAEWPAARAQRDAALAAELALAARTVDAVACGEQQQEVNHSQRGERTETSLHYARTARGAQPGGWFEYQLACDPAAELELQCVWWGDDANRAATLRLDGIEIAMIDIDRTTPDGDSPQTIALPRALTAGKRTITLRIAAPADRRAPQLLSVRLLRRS